MYFDCPICKHVHHTLFMDDVCLSDDCSIMCFSCWESIKRMSKDYNHPIWCIHNWEYVDIINDREYGLLCRKCDLYKTSKAS